MRKAGISLLMMIWMCALVSAQPQISIQDLEPFMDGVIGTLMKENKVNGVTVSVVKDTSILWSKGYGFADSERGVVVDPAKTLFRIGSVSKLFVWTAVMQLYEEGKIDLDADLRYLTREFDIPNAFNKPITLKHLMSHTPGFEDYYLNLFSVDSLPPRSLGEELNKHMPAQVRPPGTQVSYSNHGTAIAAYIVEEISGLKWDDYVELKIFEPLGMKLSSFRYILPDHLKEFHSKGYVYQNGEYKSKPLKGIPLAPAGLACSSAEDIAPFMIAHLNHGRYKDKKILDSTTVALMHSTLFTHDPDLKGMLYGFFDHSKNGYKIIGHGGATEYFFSMLMLLVDEGYGIFVSTNTMGGTSIAQKVPLQFIDRYFTDTLERKSPISTTPDVLERYKGNYLGNRRPITRMSGIMALFNPYLKVDYREGQIVIKDNNEITFWNPIGLKTFQHDKTTDRIAFGKRGDDEYRYLYMDDRPHVAYEKVRFIESKQLHFSIFILAIGLGIFAFFYWVLLFFFKKAHRIRTRRQLSLTSKSLAVINPLLCIVFIVFMGQYLDGDFLFRSRTVMDYVIFSLPAFIAILVFFQLVKAVQLFSKNIPGRAKMFYSLLALSMVGVIWQFIYWNLMGYQF